MNQAAKRVGREGQNPSFGKSASIFCLDVFSFKNSSHDDLDVAQVGACDVKANVTKRNCDLLRAVTRGLTVRFPAVGLSWIGQSSIRIHIFVVIIIVVITTIFNIVIVMIIIILSSC